MRSARAIALSISLFVAGCGETDPGTQNPTGGRSGSAVPAAGTGAGGSAGAATAGSGTSGSGGSRSTAGRSGAGGSAGAAAGSGGSAPAAGGGGNMGGAGGAMAGAGGAPPNTDGSLFPIKTGNSWTFRTMNAGVAGMKTQTVMALEMVGGTGPKAASMAYHLVTMKDGGGDKTESWQAEVDGKIVRYRERSYSETTGDFELEEHWDPYKLRIDGTRLMPGAMYTEQYSETKLEVGMSPVTATSSDTWKVISMAEEVTVPAGTFTAVVIEKVGGASSSKRYWFVRGIGKVKETGGNQTEELVSHTVMP